MCFTENLAAGTGTFTVTDGINSWMDEAADYDPEDPQPSHFTQVVWKSTTNVGCAFITCPPGSIFPEVYGVRILPPAFIHCPDSRISCRMLDSFGAIIARLAMSSVNSRTSLVLFYREWKLT